MAAIVNKAKWVSKNQMTKVISLTNQKRRRESNEPIRTGDTNTGSLRQARENAYEQVTIGFASDWLTTDHISKP